MPLPHTCRRINDGLGYFYHGLRRITVKEGRPAITVWLKAEVFFIALLLGTLSGFFGLFCSCGLGFSSTAFGASSGWLTSIVGP